MPPERVALFATCLGDRFFAEACTDTVRVLRHFGVEVDVPPGQTCCGQPAYNIGQRAQAARMARHTSSTFATADYVVLPSGSCAGMIRGFYAGLLRVDDVPIVGHGSAMAAPVPDESRETLSLPERTYELSEFLVHVLRLAAPAPEMTPLGPDSSRPPLGTGLAGKRIAYHHGCHALRELGVREEPLALLRACGAEVVPWEADTECCGFGGLFSSKFPEVSAGMADRKLDALPPVIDAVASADGGCLLQLSGRARRRAASSTGPSHASPRFVHLATLLREGIGA
jgi:L-lactate dehydrogenase complex protein LldE